MAMSAGVATAQSAAPAEAGSDREAVELERRAADATRDFADWGKASRLYRRAGELRADDPAAAKHFRMAGLLAFYSGHQGDAVDDLKRAGESALAWGDLRTAARSFLDAAWVAEADGHNRRALELAQRGERLAYSPLLAAQDRAALLRRIADGPSLPELPELSEN
jgi:hypothetical protein